MQISKTILSASGVIAGAVFIVMCVGGNTLVWSQPSIRHSYFKNANGEIHNLSPWRLVDYWSWTRAPDLGEYVVT